MMMNRRTFLKGAASTIIAVPAVLASTTAFANATKAPRTWVTWYRPYGVQIFNEALEEFSEK